MSNDIRFDQRIGKILQRPLNRRLALRGSFGVLGASALAGLLAACGGSGSSTTTSSGGSSSGSSGSSTTPAGTTASSASSTPGSGGITATRTATTGTPRKGGNLVVAFNADPETLDPHNTTALLAARVLALIHDNLVAIDYDGSFKPELAEKWDVSPDGKTYTFNLKQGVKFHSGKDFTSADVKYTFERWLGNSKSPTSYTIQPIDTIDTPDANTVKFNLKQPYNIFLDQLGGSWAVILNKDAVDKAGQDYGVNAAEGTGPFKFGGWTRNQKINLSRFDAYNWGSPVAQNKGPAWVDTVEIRIIPEDNTRIAEFQAGNIQLVQDVPGAQVDQLSKGPGVTIVKYEQLQTTYFGMNTAKAPLDDVKVRQAISYAINKDEVVKGAYFGLGTAARTMLHPKTPYFWQGALDIAPTFDLNKAKQMLDDAGWKAGAGGVREKNGQQLVIPYWIINDPATVLQSQILEQQLGKAGIKLDTKQYEQTAWFAAARSGDQVGFTVGVFYSNADVLYFYFYSKQQPSPNRFSYASPDMDNWLVDARTNPDKSKIADDYQNAQKRLIEDAPAAPLIHSTGTLGKADVVEGVQVHPSRWLMRMLDIYLKK